MNMHAATNTPAGRLTILAALVAGLSTSAFAAPADLVISQVYGGGASANSTYNRDYIELFNRGSTDIGLKGKSLHYASATGANWSSWNALPDVTLKPGQYFLVAGTVQAAGADIGTIDHPWSMSLAATAGTVALANTTSILTAHREHHHRPGRLRQLQPQRDGHGARALDLHHGPARGGRLHRYR